MCQKVIINNGETELSTVNDFKDYFGGELPSPNDETEVLEEDGCLCQIDIASELKKRNIPFTWDGCDYNVTGN